jgi:hypothetical protein
MADKQWKQRERGTAALLGTVRIPSSGKAAPDIIADLHGHRFAVEHKSLKAGLPLWLSRALDQATRNAPDGSLPLVIVAASAGPGRPTRRVAMLDRHHLPALLRLGAEGGCIG